MNLSVKFAERLPPSFAITPTLRGLLKLGFFRSFDGKKGFRGISYRQMAWNLKRCDSGIKIKAGAVLPATEIQVEEAITAIKAGKVVAVPMDTLYGFT